MNRPTLPKFKVRGERGAAMVEYALLLALLALVVVAAVNTFGESLGGEYGDINSSIESNLDSRP